MTEATPAGRLVRAFGDPDAMAALYAPDVAWSLSASAGYPRPIAGRDAVVAFNREVWERHYHPDCTVEILDELGDDALSAVRFVYRARLRADGRLYENEYTLFARSGRQGIGAVFEAFDTALARDFVRAGQTA